MYIQLPRLFSKMHHLLDRAVGEISVRLLMLAISKLSAAIFVCQDYLRGVFVQQVLVVVLLAYSCCGLKS